MKIKYLGTAAAEGWPAIFCNCEACLKAKKLGGKNIRTRSQSLIDGELLVDFPMDSYMHMLFSGEDFTKVKNLIVTHSHPDHFYPLDLMMREGVFAHKKATKTLNLFLNAEAKKKYFAQLTAEGKTTPIEDVNVNQISSFTPFATNGYKITPLPANHKLDEEAFNYIIEKNGKTILYMNDTGKIFEEVYDYFVKNSIKADLVSLDCTLIFNEQYENGRHMNFEECETERKKMIELGIATDKTVFVLNHFSHNSKIVYDELVGKTGDFIVSYDGLEIEF